MANYYGSPAQAKFIDTYVPIPFDALMGLSENAKLERQTNEKRLDDIRVKYGNFTSRSQADMNRWNQEVTRPLQDVANRISSNPDAIKGEEGRMLISSVINNMNYSGLDRLRQNAVNLDEAYKSYDPRWRDNTLQDISTWDTASQGLYNKQNIPYKSLKELGDPFFNDLKPGYIQELSNNKEDWYGITQNDLNRVAGSAYTSLYSDPTFQKHMQRIGATNLPPEQQMELARRILVQDQQERVRVHERKARPEALEAQRNANRLGAISYRASLANKARSEATGEDFNRVDATKVSILEGFQKDKRFTNGQQLTNDYLKRGSVNTPDPELNRQIQQTTNRLMELSNKQRSGRLSPNELRELNNLSSTVTNGIPKALGEVGELDYKIAQLKQNGLPESMSKFLDEGRNKILEYTLKMDPSATPNLSPERRRIAEEQYNNYQQYFNQSLQRSLDYLGKVNNISDDNKKNLVDRLGGYRTGAIAESNIDDETASQMGTEFFRERVATSVLNKESKAGISYKATDKVLGVPATKAGVIRLLDYKGGSSERYISSNDNSIAGRLSNALYNNPSAFEYQIADPDKTVSFGSTTAPVLVKSDGGKATVHVKNANGREVPEFAAKQKIQAPVQGLMRWLSQESEMALSDKERQILFNVDAEGNPKEYSASEKNEITSKTKKQVMNLLKNELGYSPKVTTINGLEYFILDGGNQMFGDPESNISYNYRWKNSRSVDYKKKNDDVTYKDTGMDAWNSVFNATGDGED